MTAGQTGEKQRKKGSALSTLLVDRDKILADRKVVIAALTDCTALEKKAEIIDSALAGVAARIEQLVKSSETDTYISHDVVMRVEILLQDLTSDLSFTIMSERKVTLPCMEVIMANNTKERILAAALEMFSQNGYAGTNIRELSASLGLVKSGVYKHFESKEAIWNALLDEMNGWMKLLRLPDRETAVR